MKYKTRQCQHNWMLYYCAGYLFYCSKKTTLENYYAQAAKALFSYDQLASPYYQSKVAQMLRLYTLAGFDRVFFPLFDEITKGKHKVNHLHSL